ncbi:MULTISPECIES: hypothetical protein [Nocardia]|uniref:hypothetical protein n=1 Tax=Nocardia TaxID=1817 RepID=UPI00245777B8|nr:MULTISPECIES: hypothetical protein [Nocardia]
MPTLYSSPRVNEAVGIQIAAHYQGPGPDSTIPFHSNINRRDAVMPPRTPRLSRDQAIVVLLLVEVLLIVLELTRRRADRSNRFNGRDR